MSASSAFRSASDLKPFEFERLPAAKSGRSFRRDHVETGLVEKPVQRRGERLALRIVARRAEHMSGATAEIDDARAASCRGRRRQRARAWRHLV